MASTQTIVPRPQTIRLRRVILLTFLFAVLACIVVIGIKGWRIYGNVQAVRKDVTDLTGLAQSPRNPALVQQLGPLLARTRADTAALRGEMELFLPLTQQLSWVPRYGSTIIATEPLLDLATDLSTAAQESYISFSPLLLNHDSAQPLTVRLAQQLNASKAHLAAAQQSIAHAITTRAQIQVTSLEPVLQAQFGQLDMVLPAAKDALEVAAVVPDVLGVGAERTYLFVLQDPRELRATGGFIGADGIVTLQSGRLSDFSVDDVTTVDDVENQVYPDPPAPLLRYMGIEMWLFRDANWSPDFPTSARDAINLYNIGQKRDITGVIALDPNFLPIILRVVGPVVVDGQTVSADNVLTYIEQQYAANFPNGRKNFMKPLATAMIAQVESTASKPDNAALVQALQAALNQRHLLLYINQPVLANVLAQRGWDGSVQPGSNDYLMVVDSNVGYNKVNPHIEESLSYSVDLSNVQAPVATTIVRHTHHLQEQVPCTPFGSNSSTAEGQLIGCYWDYLRLLVPDQSRLIDATHQPIPGEWLPSGTPETGQTEMTTEHGARAFHTMLVIQPGETRETSYTYQLPSRVCFHDSDGWHYRLRLQKQGGTTAIPVSIRVKLPRGAQIASSSLSFNHVSDGSFEQTIHLSEDQVLDLTFR